MNIVKSLEMQERAKQCIPGMTQLLSKRPDQFSQGVWPGYFSKASGVEVWDLDGNKYIDMSIAGIGANVLGYADPDVDSAVIRAIEAGTSSSLNCPEEVELADLLCEIHPWAKMVRYSRTGGESMAIAVRIARAYTSKDKVVFCGYHGWHDWYLAANLRNQENDMLEGHLLPGLNPRGVPKSLHGTAIPFRYNRLDDLHSVIQANKGEIAAISMEPIRNIQPDDGFLEGVREAADSCGAVLIFDEISSGLRLNAGGAHLKLGVEPDIAVFSKALGNGYPIGAVIGRSRIMDTAQDTFISSTNWTERIGPTAALAVLKKHRKLDVGSHLVTIGTGVQEGWKSSAEKAGLQISIGGIPPLSHFNFDAGNPLSLKALFVELMLKKEFLASNLFYAMFAHTKSHVSSYIEAVSGAFEEMAALIAANEVEKKLDGLPASQGFARLT